MFKDDFRRKLEGMKTGLGEALRASGETAERAVRAISEAVSAAMHDPHAASERACERVAECASATVSALRHLGARVGRAARGAMLGALRGTQGEHVWAVEIVESVSGALVHRAILDHVELAPVVRGAIEGAVEAAQELGFSGSEAASAAATAALRAASDDSANAVRVVRAAIPAQVRGVTIHVREEMLTHAAGSGGTHK